MSIGLLNNDLIKDLRTNILLKNLNPTPEATLGGLGSLNVDRGLPVETSLSQGDYIPLNQYNVSSLGYYQLKDLSLKNRYAPSTFSPVEFNNVSAIAGNIGIYTEYVRTNAAKSFDLKQFVLNTPNFIGYSDTPLGIIGAEQLKFSLMANIAQNASKNTLGRINLNLFSLLNGEELLIRDYQITQVPNTPLGFFVNLAQKYSGFELPVSYIPGGAFDFLDNIFDGKVNHADCNLLSADVTLNDKSRLDGKERNDLLLRYTGRGNRVQLFNLLGINKYRPKYNDPNGSDTGLNRIFGFLQSNPDKGELYGSLDRTRRYMGTLPVMLEEGIADPSQETGDFTSIGKTGAFTKNDVRSVLQENGLPIIGPTKRKNTADSTYKKFMFSIENLAWIGYTEGLPDCEIGNGDTDSADPRPGRIMWFPPYDLSFDENVSVQWDKTNFIGRGEPVFTYNNTLRSGTIKFKVVVDHPSIINQLKDKWAEDEILKFFKGCGKDNEYVLKALTALDYLSPKLSKDVIETTEQKIIETAQRQFKVENTYTTKPGGTKQQDIKIYYDNNQTSVTNTYENPGLNSAGIGFESTEIVNYLQDLVPDDIDRIDVTISVATSSLGSDQVNQTLSDGRFASASSWINSNVSGIKCNITRGESVVVPNTSGSPNDLNAKLARYAFLSLTIFLKDLKQSGTTTVETTTFSKETVQDKVKNEVLKIFANVYSECNYFQFLETTDSFLFESLKDKLKYFNPGFHSTSPEGFNSRLTFLHQCTRQGPAINSNEAKSNLVFGRPPICILRIGDFFHTKMVIESLSIQYDENLWDLNPEGIGVQPRLATVSLSVSYIGGHSLMNPVRELQNALGFKFYANTETFQHAPKVLFQSITKIDETPSGVDVLNEGKTDQKPVVTPTIDEINNTTPITLNEVTNQLVPANQQPLGGTNTFFQDASGFLNQFNNSTILNK
jgi:hypothetical protein